MIIQTPTNIDYLIPQFRILLGDTQTPYQFDDSILRSFLLQGIVLLQRRWRYRYAVCMPDMITVDPTTNERYLAIHQHQGLWYLPSGVATYDVVRNPFHDFFDQSSLPISQEDVYPVLLAGVVVARQSQLASSATDFQTWSDGSFSFSNVASQRALVELLNHATNELNKYFALRLANARLGL